MAVYEYRAINSQGRSAKGLVDAESIRAARQKLKLEGIFPTSLTESGETTAKKGWNVSIEFKSQRVSLGQLSIATRQLATLLVAGMPLVEALRALGDQLDNPRLRVVVAEVATMVNEGSTLADALRSYPKVFPNLYNNMVASGEVSGSLDTVLERLADLMEAQVLLRRKVLSAMTYPILMLVLCFGVLILLLAYVVPQITSIFDEQGATLPLPTRIVITASEFSQSYWWVIFVLAAAAYFAFRRYRETPEGRRRIDELILKAPLFGPLALKIATSRLARNLGTMLASGIQLLTALSIAKNIVGNAVLEEAVENAADGVREGQGLAEELKKPEVFPTLLTHMIAVGEKTGQLESMLLRAADSYESEVDAMITALTSILEPLLIVFITCVVGGILASVMLPMLEMSSLTGV